MFESSSAPVPEPEDAWVGLASEYLSDADLLAYLRVQPAGPGLLHDLSCVDPATLSADDAVTYAQQVDRLVAHVAGFQAQARAAVNSALVAAEEAERARLAEVLRRQNEERVAAGLRPRSNGFGFVPPEMAVEAELAAALRLSPRSVSSQVQFAVDLAGPWRPMRAAMLDGDITESHAKAIGRVLALLPAYADPKRAGEYAAGCADVLAKVLPYARSHTPGLSAKKARDLITAIDPVGTRKRRQEAADKDHGVFLTPREPGTTELTAVMPTETAQAVYDAVRRLAADARFDVADGCITIGQRRVAALRTLVLGDPGQITVIDGPVAEAKEKAHVSVVVSLETILGVSEQGGRINGEPVTADVVRDLLASCDPRSTIRRLVTDTTGVIVDYGRTRYIGSDLQKHLIRLRDGHCRGIGCTRPAEMCEVDHAESFGDGGATTLANQGPLCKHHHQLKTHHHWHITFSAADGSCTWRSPLGREYEHQPPPLLPPPPRLRVIDDGQQPPF